MSGGKAGWVLLGGAAVLAAGSIGYNVIGSGEPEAETVATADTGPSMEDLRAAANASSDDAGPWSELAFAHFQRNEFGDAVSAYERAVEIDDSAAALWSALGEARVMAVDAASAAADPLPQIALDAFEKALELDPSDPRSRYFLAVKKDIDGDHQGAITDWLALLSDTPPGAPWESDVVRTIQQVGAINDIAVDQRLATVMETRAAQTPMLPGSGAAAGPAASANIRGPSAQQVVEASRMPPGEQRTMAEGMVARLESRLESEPTNVDGWVMLMRSRMTLGEPDAARAALDSAIAANPSRAGELRAAAEQLGVR
ncbi:cytochrome c-type biogenesis protein cycH [Erythrobacter sp. NAP1]|uniref:tetratricopeptide repeat protein n=1 Tax=Erythrobacter sp. NAP1 TaxID=237727 RepID=UPI0000685239|nr:tetratricopeptide repeat protein [Erythrobacter sp. NAP1]EAQ27830.1 cytochrome c-type biogenesis protein cycH [Erythrobacter sp. NAP1]